MIAPIIHRILRRSDLAQLVTAIRRHSPLAAREAAALLEQGHVDTLLDAEFSVAAVRGDELRPGPVPLSLLWYIPVRATMLAHGEANIPLADLTASVPLMFTSHTVVRRVSRGDPGIVNWTRSIESMPRGTVAYAERAAFCAALAIWWAGCFPERVERSGGAGAIRAYIDFSQTMLTKAADILQGQACEQAMLYHHAANAMPVIYASLRTVRTDYLRHRR